MPWRVGQNFRHLSQAVFHLLERSRTPLSPVFVCSKTQLLHSSRGVLWPPPVASTNNYSHAAGTEDAKAPPEVFERPHLNDRSLHSVLRWDWQKEDADGNQLVAVTPPAEVLSTLELFFARHPQRCTKLDLRQSRSTVDLAVYLRHPRATGVVLYFLDRKDPERALWVLRLSLEVGLTVSPKTWPRLIERFAEIGKWEAVLRLVNVARKTLGYTTTALLNWRLQALTETRHYIPLEEALAVFEEGRVRASNLTYHLLVSMHLRNSDLAGAISSLRAMESAGFPVTARTCAVVVLSYRSLGCVPQIKEQALAALDTDEKNVSNATFNGLIQLMLDAEDIPGVVDVLSSASQSSEDFPSNLGAGTIPVGVVPSVAESAAGSRDPSSGPRGQLVDINTFNVLLHHFAHRGDLPQALQVVQRLRSAQARPDSATAAALVQLYFASGYPNDGLHVLAGVLVDYPAALALLPKLGFVKDARPEHPIPPPTPPTIQIINALLRGAMRAHDYKGLETVLSIMRIVKVDANPTTCTILLSHALRRQGPRYREMINIVRSLMSSGSKPTLQHLHALLQPLLRDERAVAYPRGWVQTSPRPANDSASPLAEPSQSTPPDYSSGQPPVGTAEPFLPVAGFTLPRHRRQANLLRPIFQSLTARNVRADRATFAMRIKHDALVKRDVKAAHRTLREMMRRGMQPNRYHYGALMEGYAAAGDMLEAIEIMQAASEAGYKADVKTYTILIAGYSRLGQASKAVEVFRNMVAEGIRPDVPAVDALVSAFFRVKAYAAARRILLELWPDIAPFPDGLGDASLRELAVTFRALHLTSPSLPKRLSAPEQRMLKRKMQAMLQTWTGAVGKSEKVTFHTPMNRRLHRRLQYIRTEG